METQTLNYNNRNFGNVPPQSNNNNNNNEVGNRSEELSENTGRQGLNLDHGFIQEIEAYQSLMLDFETEFAGFLSAELPKCPTENSNEDVGTAAVDEGNRGRRLSSSGQGGSSRRSSSVTNSRSSFDGTNGNGSSGGIRYNFDGTISCCDISYDLLVSFKNQTC